MHDNFAKTHDRAVRALHARLLPQAQRLRERCDVSVFASGRQVPVPEALSATYVPASAGLPWGAPWSTTWFRVSGKIPAEWADRHVEAVLDLGFNDRSPGFQAEGMAFAVDGSPIKGVSPRNNWVPIDQASLASGAFTFYVEAVGMPSIMGDRGADLRQFRPTPMGDTGTAGSEPLYSLGEAALVARDEEAEGLAFDFEVLLGVLEQLEAHSPRRHEILRALERCLDAYDMDGDTSAARLMLRPVLDAPAVRTAHRISAVGHAHIDSAWLWPVRETVRKCARTFSNVAALAEQYPELVFACSSAQQWYWIKEKYPAIYERMRLLVRKGQIVPVGSMWVEPDTNVPSGESLARHLIMGKRFFLDELGVETDDVWLPDCFGYSAALPQLILLAGSRWFLTQKISWNDTNKFPHHTLWWEGIDGSRVFSHFPPVDTYNAQMLPKELAKAARDYGEIGYGSRSLVPFGFGDGGGGPTREMMERARRMADLDGAPRVTHESPSEFFSAALEELPGAPVWAGELYLELHRGTLTNQVEIKQGNRRCENLAREAELWSTAAMVAGRADYPYEELEDIWRDILLNQFHDILPGSSIAMVNDEAVASSARSAARLVAIVDSAISALAGIGEVPLAFNAAPHARNGVAGMSAGQVAGPRGKAHAGPRTLENDLLRVALDDDGHLVSLFDKRAAREVVPAGFVAKVLQLHPDYPNNWPAWDIDPFYNHSHLDIGRPRSIAVRSSGPEEAVLELEYEFSSSRVTETLRLEAGSEALVVELEVEWHEHERLLKLALPLDVHADESVAEIQFGHLRRPTHNNTSWDNARFETVAHRYLYLGEAGYGVALVNSGTYGHDVSSLPRQGGGKAAQARMTVIRSANFPDPRGESGLHRFGYAIVPGATVEDAVRHGYWFNLPARRANGAAPVAPLVALSNDAIVVEAVKAADDRSGDVVVRCYEALGGRADGVLTTSFSLAGAEVTDLLERRLEELSVAAGNQVHLQLRPFQILTLRLRPEQ